MEREEEQLVYTGNQGQESLAETAMVYPSNIVSMPVLPADYWLTANARRFQAYQGPMTNPLLQAATRVTALIKKLRHTFEFEDLSALHAQLLAELNQFEARVRDLNYRPDTVLLARYVLSVTLDDVIEHTEWGSDELWQAYRLLNNFSKQAWNRDHFFNVLDKLWENPGFRIDLLELMYVCLRLGFEGKYRYKTHGEKELQKLAQALFQNIQISRQEKAPIKKTTLYAAKHQEEPQLVKSISIRWLIVFTFSAIITIYAGLTYLLNQTAKPVFSSLQKIHQATTIASDHDESTFGKEILS